jgi:hypothetical protein
MWRNDLVGKLRNVDNCEDLKYLPSADVKDLHLEALGCDAETILVREEYLSTVRELEYRRPNIGGMVVTGQPGTGTGFTEGHGSPCSRTHNMQENQFFCFVCSSISLARGSPLPYNMGDSFICFLEVASKSIMVKPPGGISNLKGNFGLYQILAHVNRFNGLVRRNAHTLSTQPPRQKISGRNGEMTVVEHFT